MGEDQRSLEALWSRRAKAFREETIPYFRYMGQSGFPAFLSLILISSAIGYFTLIRNLPANFPIAATGVICLTAVLCWSPLRTWLQAADIVFMMPREADISGYIRHSLRYTFIGSSILAALVLLLYLPIYNQGPALSGGWVLALAAAGLKAGNTWGAWKERQLAVSDTRRLLRLLRWALTALVLAVWLTCELWQAAVFSLLACALFMLVHRYPKRHRFPWERLIEEEGRTRKRYYAFFGWFIDVPSLPSKASKRSYLSWLLRAVPYSHRSTFVYLYTATFLRAEVGGIVLRLLVLGSFVTYWAADVVSLSGWGAVIAFAIFLSVLAVQIGGLRHVHRYSVWKHVYPLPDKQRVEHLLRVDRMVMLVCAAILWVFAAIPLALSQVYIPSAAAAAGALVYLISRPARLRKKIERETEEE